MKYFFLVPLFLGILFRFEVSGKRTSSSVKVGTNVVQEVKKVGIGNGQEAIEIGCRRFEDTLPNTLYCVWIRPDGEEILNNGYENKQYVHGDNGSYCWLRFNYLYEEQMRNWKCRLSGWNSKDEFFNDVSNVNLNDSYQLISSVIGIRDSLNVIVTANDNYYANLLEVTCDVETDEEYSDCQLTRGHTIYDFKYSHGFGKKCREVIHNPTDSDFGEWTCFIVFDNIIVKSTVNVKRNITEIERDLRVNSLNGFTQPKPGKDFTVGCKIRIPLKSCRIISPSGVIYETTQGNEFFPSNITYTRGLKNNECSVLVKFADRKNTGNWTCILGLQGNLKVTSIIQIELSEPYLIPDENVDTVSDNVHFAKTLTCKASDHGQVIDYCRWTHPDGTEIMEKHHKDLKIEKSPKACSVRLKSFDENDFGEWKCHVFMNKYSNKESHAIVPFGKKHVDFRNPDSSSIVGFTICVIVLGGFIGYLCYCCLSMEKSIGER